MLSDGRSDRGTTGRPRGPVPATASPVVVLEVQLVGRDDVGRQQVRPALPDRAQRRVRDQSKERWSRRFAADDFRRNLISPDAARRPAPAGRVQRRQRLKHGLDRLLQRAACR